MSRTFWGSTALGMLILVTGSMPAIAQSSSKYVSNCRATSANGNTRITCGDNIESLSAKPGPMSREDVAYSKRPEPAPTKNAANFCGAGFRLAGDGTCQLAP
jgi:hypothetical protein